MKYIIILLTTLIFLSACKKESGNSSGPNVPDPNDTTQQIIEKCYLDIFNDAGFHYDTNGRVYQMSLTNSGLYEYTYTATTQTIHDYTTTTPTIHTATINSFGYITYFNNKKDKVITTAQYDAQGFVTEIIEKDYTGSIIVIEKFIYQNGNMVERKELWPNGTSYDTMSFMYTYHLDKENKGRVLYYKYENHPIKRFFHKPDKNLLEQETQSYLSYIYRFEYLLDSKKLPTRLKITKNGIPTYSFLYSYKCW